jgi:hypothetical protein
MKNKKKSRVVSTQKGFTFPLANDLVVQISVSDIVRTAGLTKSFEVQAFHNLILEFQNYYIIISIFLPKKVGAQLLDHRLIELFFWIHQFGRVAYLGVEFLFKSKRLFTY